MDIILTIQKLNRTFDFVRSKGSFINSESYIGIYENGNEVSRVIDVLEDRVRITEIKFKDFQKEVNGFKLSNEELQKIKSETELIEKERKQEKEAKENKEKAKPLLFEVKKCYRGDTGGGYRKVWYENKDEEFWSEEEKQQYAQIMKYAKEVGINNTYCAGYGANDTKVLAMKNISARKIFFKALNNKDEQTANEIRDDALEEFNEGEKKTLQELKEIFPAEIIELVDKREAEKVSLAKQKELKHANEQLLKFQQMTDKQIAEELYTSQVHVDEEMHFSDCPDFCDDCCWYKHYNKDVLEIVKGKTETFSVMSKYKTYTYYEVSEEATEAIISAKKSEIDAYRQQEIEKFKKIIEGDAR